MATAYNYEVPLSYTINVTLASAPAGLADFNVNSIAIFSNEPALFSESYRAYMTPSAVSKDFGSDSLTAKMATALFTPAPNFRTGSGMLYIFPFKGVNATAGSVTTADISANLNNFKTVTNGALNLTIDGTPTLIQGLDFTTVQTLEDVATVIKAQNPDADIQVEENKIKFTSRRFGTDAAIAITAATGDGITDISGADYLNSATAETVAGTNASGQTLSDAVQSALQQVYFGGVLTTQFADNETVQANAAAIQSMDVTFFNEITSPKNIAVLGKDLKAAGLGKTRSLLMSNSAQQAKIAIATYATIAKSVNWKGTNTANTMNLKTLTGCVPDTGLGYTLKIA